MRIKSKSRYPLVLAVSAVVLMGCQSRPVEDPLAVVSSEQSSELVTAIAQGNEKDVQSLIAKGYPINVTSSQGSALDRAAAAGMDAAVLDMLAGGANPRTGAGEGHATAIHYYAERGNVRMIRALALAGADLEATDEKGRTPLAAALTKGQLSASKTLIRAGADVNTSFAGRSLLMHIVTTNSLLLTQLMIDAGVDLNYRNAEGISALDVAQQGNLQDVQMLLVKSGAE
ncbi:MAG: ankyrin repeat domain-containing protein [Hahellaceae bacterium]|nr:ankyrin repeat domain-containing protein [Hahellaceae bacterium]